MALASAGKPFTLDFSGNTALKGDELSFSLPYTSQLSENGKSIYVEVESAEELLVPILLSELLKVDTKSKAPADNAVGAESGVTKTTEYEGVADGKVSLKLTDKPDGKVHVALSTSIDGSCSGGVEAIGVRAGQRIEAESKASNPADICKIAIEFSNEGSVASVSELTPGCNELHGASCSFSGKLNRKGH